MVHQNLEKMVSQNQIASLQNYLARSNEGLAALGEYVLACFEIVTAWENWFHVRDVVHLTGRHGRVSLLSRGVVVVVVEKKSRC